MTTAPANSDISISADSSFAAELHDLIHAVRPKRILETGTHHATGTTRIIGEALKECGLNADFRSIEVNADNVAIAKANVEADKLPVKVEHGLSIPRSMLPTADGIAAKLAALPDNIFADHDPDDRVWKYLAETDYPVVADDLIGKVLADWDYLADLVVLDSAGHIGYREFCHVAAHLRGACWFAVDDSKHIKHWESRTHMLSDPKHFRVIADSDERFGWIIAHYMP